MNYSENVRLWEARGYFPTYIHFLWANETKFNLPIIKFANDEKSTLNIKEHVFVTPHPELYGMFSEKFENVFLDDSGKALLNSYGRYGSPMLCHSLPPMSELFFTKAEYRKRTLIRYWGGLRQEREAFGKSWPDRLGAWLWNCAYALLIKAELRGFGAIGVANVVDVIDLERFLPQTPMFKFPTPNGSGDEVERVLKLGVNRSDGLRVMVGHRSDPGERHIECLEILKKYSRENLQIFLPMTYGDPDYRRYISDYVKVSGYENVEIIDKYMDFPDYVNFLGQVDVGIFDVETSCALGNISLLLSLGKTVYVSDTGVIRKALLREGVPHHTLGELRTMGFSEFNTLLDVGGRGIGDFACSDSDAVVRRWREALDFLSFQMGKDRREGERDVRPRE